MLKQIKDYDPTKQSKYILYLDMNNLHGWGMSRYLLYGRFEWLKNISKFGANSISKKSPIGYFSKLILNILMNYMYYAMIIH